MFVENKFLVAKLIQSIKIEGMTVPMQVLISVLLGYSVSVEANAGAFLIWTFSAQTLLLHLPVAISETPVQYSRQADFS